MIRLLVGALVGTILFYTGYELVLSIIFGLLMAIFYPLIAAGIVIGLSLVLAAFVFIIGGIFAFFSAILGFDSKKSHRKLSSKL